LGPAAAAEHADLAADLIIRAIEIDPREPSRQARR
jgi:hypothetical protein